MQDAQEFSFSEGRFLLPSRNDLHELARSVGALSLTFFRGALDIAEKPDDAGLVTQADLACEEHVKGWIRAKFPDHRILGEESGWTGVLDAQSPTPLWIIDPIDGTTNFSNGNPYYCCSIGFGIASPGQPFALLAGAIAHPATGDIYTALRGEGAQCNGIALGVNPNTAFARASFCTGFSSNKGSALVGISQVIAAVQERTIGLRVNGAAALDLAFVSRGLSHGFFEWSLKPWDLAAGALLVQEAGGVVTNLDGLPFDLLRDDSVLCANPALHAELFALLRQMSSGASSSKTR
ncbi:MAG: inositol monophosphatase [Silvanigrellales bacterium]|nr:inositol monophosphatase [Silvanigrellales bacterium]